MPRRRAFATLLENPCGWRELRRAANRRKKDQNCENVDREFPKQDPGNFESLVDYGVFFLPVARPAEFDTEQRRCGPIAGWISLYPAGMGQGASCLHA